MYSLYLYFLGLSFRSTVKAIEPFAERSHVAIVSAYLIEEIQVQIRHSEAIWLWIAITELVHIERYWVTLFLMT
jgi:hypothetical protein